MYAQLSTPATGSRGENKAIKENKSPSASQTCWMWSWKRLDFLRLLSLSCTYASLFLCPIIPVWQLGAAPSLSVQALGLPKSTTSLCCRLVALLSHQGFSKVFFLFPSPPQKRVQERVAGCARPRPTGNTLFTNLGWGACCQAERLLRSAAFPFAQLPAQV